MLEKIRKASRNEDGASAVEYGLLVAAIAAIIVIIVFALGSVLQGSFQDTCTKIVNGGDGNCSTTAPASAG